MYVKLNIYYIHLKYRIILSKYIHTKTTNTAEKTNKCSPQECPHVYTQRFPLAEHCIVHKGKLIYMIIYIWYFYANYKHNLTRYHSWKKRNFRKIFKMFSKIKCICSLKWRLCFITLKKNDLIKG